jgi:hypothetical protein
MKITSNVIASFAALTLLFTLTVMWMPPIADAAPTDVAYFAVYCPQGGGLSSTYAADNVLTCHQGGKPPLFEANVDSLTSNPNGANFVTIVEADCYPDTSQVPKAPATPTGHIDCGTAPDATLTLGDTFPAAGSPSPGPSSSLPGPTGVSGVNLPQVPANGTSVQTVLEMVFGVLGALAVLMVTVSGLRYVLSAGDPSKIARAKDGIIYSLVGVAVAISAEGIIYFVLSRL